MKNITEPRKYKVCTMECLNNSVNGNPRYSMLLQDINTGEYVQCKTASDYSYNYVITSNMEFIIATIRLTRAGKAIIETLERSV